MLRNGFHFIGAGIFSGYGDEAAHRAGYHAFLTVGLVAFVLVSFFRSGGTVEHPHRLVSFFLALLWFTWLFSSLLAYWGPPRAAAWILRVFGSVVLVFTIVSNLGPEWTGWAALLLHPLLAAPFFILAWLSGRWPRVSGLLLLSFSALLLFRWFGNDNLALITQGVHIAGFSGGWVSGVHNDDDYERTLAGFDAALLLLKNE